MTFKQIQKIEEIFGFRRSFMISGSTIFIGYNENNNYTIFT